MFIKNLKSEIALFASVLLAFSGASLPVLSQEEAASSAEGQRFSLPAAGALSNINDSSVEGKSGSELPPKASETGQAKQGKDSETRSATLPADSYSQQAGALSQKTAKSSIAISNTAAVPLASIYRGKQAVAQDIVLPNGLKVLILENHEFPIVSTLVWYKVGSRDEQTGSTGLSHMVEHLMFQEVGPFKPGDIGSMIARVGGQFNGYTSDDFTTFFETLPANKLEMALKIEAERMAHTRFSESEVKQEIANIQKEFENEAKDPVALLSKEVCAMMFMQHPYHNPTIGWKTDVEGLSTEHARSFYEKYFNPANATLVLSGDLNGKQATALVHKYFGTIAGPGKPAAHVIVNEPMPRSERRVNTKYGGNKELMQVAYRAPAMDDSDAPAMIVLERLLNGGSSGRLKTRLVESKVCSSAQASYEIKKEPGLFTITCTAIPATYNAQAKILEGIDSVVAQLRDKPPADADLRRARNQAEFAYFAECDGPYRAGFHLGYFDSLDKWQSSYTWADRLKAVTASDLNRVAKKYFSPDARVVGWIAGTAAPKASPPKPAASDSPKTQAPPKNLPPTAKNMEHVHLIAYKESDTDEGPKPNTSKAKEKKSGIPAVIHDLPSAVGNVVTGNIPGAVGNVGSAIINLPGAIGNIGTAVGSTATAIGKQIVQLKPGGDPASEHLHHRVLKNGINVVVFQSHISPVLQVSGSIQAGEAYSARGKAGYSLLASSLLCQGSTKRSRAQMIAAQDDLGIAQAQMLKFESGIETIDFSTRCLSRDLSTQLDLVAETLSQPLFDDATLDKAKQEALAVLKRNEESVSQKVERVLLQGLLDENSPFWPSDPSDRSKTISQSDLAETQKFFANHIVPGASTLVIAGDCNPEQAFELAEKSFAKWNGKGSHSELHAKIRPQRVLRSSVPIKDAKKSNICFGQIIPMAQSHPEYGSLLIADSILLNHPIFSRFEQALSKNPALENAISNGEMSVKLEPVSNLTRWSLSLAVEPAAVPVAVKTIKNELKLITRNGVSAEEFTEAKRYLLGVLPVKTQATLGAISNNLLDSAEHTNIVNGYTAAIASVKSASLDSVNKVIRGAFKPDQATVVIAGGAQSIKAARSPAEAAAQGNDDETGSRSKSSPAQAQSDDSNKRK